MKKKTWFIDFGDESLEFVYGEAEDAEVESEAAPTDEYGADDGYSLLS